MDSYPVDEAYTEQVLQRMEEDVEALLPGLSGTYEGRSGGLFKVKQGTENGFTGTEV